MAEGVKGQVSPGVICGPLRLLTSLLLLGNQFLPIIFITQSQTVSRSMTADTIHGDLCHEAKGQLDENVSTDIK